MGRCGPELGWNLSEVIEKPGPGTQLLSLPGQTLTQPHLLGSPRAVGRGGEGSAYRAGVPRKDGPAHLPTTISSCSVAFLRKRCHTSMVNRVLLLLKMEVSELMRAAMITATIRPRRPGGR